MRVRPRFELSSALSPDEIGTRVKAQLEHESRLRGLVLPGRIELTVCAEDQHLWSPQLTVDVHQAERGSQMRARFGPHAHVWTMYMALYGVVICFSLAALVGGSAQLTLGQTPWAFWGAAVGAFAGGLIWLLAFVGQGFGGDQMYALRVFLAKTAEADEANFEVE